VVLFQVYVKTYQFTKVKRSDKKKCSRLPNPGLE